MRCQIFSPLLVFMFWNFWSVGACAGVRHLNIKKKFSDILINSVFPQQCLILQLSNADFFLNL